tara:strand:+ start:5335 stop:5583 length:249 start_codon:yes stop_codon:yes gene_type:complete
MRKNSFPLFIFAGILILGLLVWNVYLTNEVTRLKDKQEELELKNQTLEGDNDILRYDLVTSRDSVRILNRLMSDSTNNEETD